MTEQPLLTVFYDGDCCLCQASKTALEKLDRHHRIALVPFQDESVTQRFPQLTRFELKQVIHAVDSQGHLYKGAKAYQKMGDVITPCNPSGYLLKIYSAITRLPGGLRVADKVYWWVSNNRDRLSRFLPGKPHPYP